MEIALLLIGAVLGWVLSAVLRAPMPVKLIEPRPAAPAPAPPMAASPPAPIPAPAPATATPRTTEPRQRADELSRKLAEFCEGIDQSADLASEPRFIELTALLGAAPFSAQDRLNRVTSQNIALACAALAAMTAANDDHRMGVARVCGRVGYMILHFALPYLAQSAQPEVAAAVLLRAQRWWSEHPPTRANFIAYLDSQRSAGMMPALGVSKDDGDWDLDERGDALRAIAHPVAEMFLEDLKRANRARSGARELARVGNVLSASDDTVVAENAQTRAAIEDIKQSLQRNGRPSFVLIGADGVGKTTLARCALRGLVAQGWRVIEATPAQLMAGQKYIGELEQRVENFVAGLGARSIWFVPECHQLLEQGTWSGNPHGILDLLLPHLECGALQLLGESTNAAWARVLTQRPRVEALITGMRVDTLSDAEALALARDWGVRQQARLGRVVLDPASAQEACELARQQFTERAEPGRTLELLKLALAEAERAQPPELPLGREQLLAALARSSGLPLEILDIDRPLDVAQVRAYFAARVIGQDEAVDCLVDRISMLKAGLTDPRRPLGVFLFAGPTGTGKTEIAKTLARFLFGSPERMLRFDMSEYQSDDAYWRLIDDGEQGRAQSLTTRVRQNPFAVILLDEFEKASPRIWDLFLQVFDDGRLTDRRGNSADFRHTIILLTSNLGATIGKGSNLGFVAQHGGFSRELVQRAIDATFRREFINRIDRVVVFNPLTRALMRDILEKELRDVLERRGFRQRDWAVEWEPSAIEFLLDRGFTPDLGARPLRRAIDQYLLAPLARTIVEHRVPSGEQFLFVQADGDALQVRFVDPDAPASVAAPPSIQAATDLRALAFEPRVDAQTLATLAREIQARDARVSDAGWIALKDAAAGAMQQPDFWQRPERQEVLDRLERLDRIESGLRSARTLHTRLSRSSGRGAADLVRRLALLVAAIDSAIVALLAGDPEDARLTLRPADTRSAACLAWRDRLLQMYLAWAAARGMRVQRHAVDAANGEARLTIAGFGAYQALLHETGMHVLETRHGNTDVRCTVRVAVDPDGGAPVAWTSETRICRRYDDGPAPLVKDSVRGWRSGRLDRVLAGDFDLIGEAQSDLPA